MPETVLFMFSCRVGSLTSWPMVPCPSSIFLVMFFTELMALLMSGPTSPVTLFIVSMAC